MPSIQYLLLAASLACASALAQDRPPRVGETREPPTEKSAEPLKKGDAADEQKAVPDKADKAGKPDKKDEPNQANPTQDDRKKKPPLKRRAVHQLVDGMPATRPPVSYGPVLTPPSALPVPTISPSSPVPIGSCIGASCTDTSGTRYNGGVGTTLLSPTGRLCNNNGATVSCF